jgi:hypothetical protein
MDQLYLAVLPDPNPRRSSTPRRAGRSTTPLLEATNTIRTGLLMSAEKCSGELMRLLQQGSDNWNKINALVEIAGKAMNGVRAARAEHADAVTASGARSRPAQIGRGARHGRFSTRPQQAGTINDQRLLRGNRRVRAGSRRPLRPPESHVYAMPIRCRVDVSRRTARSSATDNAARRW